MTKATFFILLYALLPLCGQPQMQGQRYIVTPVTRSPSVFVAEIEDVKTSSEPSHGVDVRVRVTRILKDQQQLGLEPGVVEVNVVTEPLTPVSATYGATWWTFRKIKTGQRFVMFSDHKTSLREMILSPVSSEEVTDEVNGVRDVELMLDASRKPLIEQAQEAALALGEPRRHGWLFAKYVTELLATGTDPETAQLSRVLESDGALAFSDEAKESLLRFLAIEYGGLYGHGVNLRSALASLTLQYLALQPTQPQERPTLLQRRILDCLPTIRKTDHDLSALRRVTLPDAVIQKLKAQAIQLSSNAHLKPAQRAEARALLSELAPK
ncbi:MAG TPA: hypothetical protein VKU19_08510 [Bryobacteraceae bacterium]|nr:hypothetical protein [Bryobacteraceae bacterium]